MIDTIEDALALLQKLQGLPAIALVALTAIITGWILKCFRRFPNDGIPLVVTMWGLWYAVVADYSNENIPLRVDIARNLFIGLIVGFGAWAFHRVALKHIEQKIPIIGPLLAKLDDPPTAAPSDTNTKT